MVLKFGTEFDYNYYVEEHIFKEKIIIYIT